MIASNNAGFDVDALMQRVREEAAAMRAGTGAGTRNGRPAPLPRAEIPPDIVVDLSRHLVIGSLIEDAGRLSRPRTAIPRRFDRMPFKLMRPAVTFFVRVLNYLFKDQRHVNQSTQQAMRELLRMTTAVGGSLSHLPVMAREQQTVVAALQLLTERVDLSETRTNDFLDLYGDANLRFEEQRAFIDAQREQIEQLSARTLALENALTVNAGRIDSLERRGDAVERATTTAALRLERIEGGQPRLDHMTTAVADTRRDLASTRQDVAATRHDLAAERERALRSESSLRTEMTAQRHMVRAGLPAATGSPVPAALPFDSDLAGVQLAIADRFRGDPSSIAGQLSTYLDVIADAGVIGSDHPVFDVGAGRGEWLATCRERNIPAFGIELDPFLAERAREDGLDVRTSEAVSTLRDMPESSLGAVTAFHVIEHLAFEQMLAFFDESLRTLAPGGMLICETPNPANVTIGACNFYLDPTHHHPLPAPLVAFLLELRGFTDIRILELQPNDEMRLDEQTEADRRINGFFYGPQNYAAVARKPGATY